MPPSLELLVAPLRSELVSTDKALNSQQEDQYTVLLAGSLLVVVYLLLLRAVSVERLENDEKSAVFGNKI